MSLHTQLDISLGVMLVGFVVLGQLQAWRQIQKHGLVGSRRHASLLWQIAGDGVGVGALAAVLTTHGTDGLGHPAPAIWAVYLVIAALVFNFVAVARKQKIITQAKMTANSAEDRK